MIEVSLLLSVNDLEAFTIVELAKDKLGGRVDIRDLKLGWGDPPDLPLARIDIARLAPTVVLVECACPAFEQAVERTGRRLYVIDHHLRCGNDGKMIDRRSPQSSLEQILPLLQGPAPSLQLRMIAANDSGFWTGMLREAAVDDHVDGKSALNAIQQVRWRDIAVTKGAKCEADIAAGIDAAAQSIKDAQAWLIKAQATGDAVVVKPTHGTPDHEQSIHWLIRCPAGFELSDRLCDAIFLQRAQEQLTAKAAWREAFDVKYYQISIAIITLGGSDDDDRWRDTRPQELFLSAKADLGDDMHAMLARLRDHASARGVTIYGGAGRDSAFLGLTGSGDIGPLIDLILNERIWGARSVANWSSQFFQILRAEAADWHPPTTLPAEDWRQICPSEQELAYFLPAVRERLTTRLCDLAQGEDPAADFDVRSFELKPSPAAFAVQWGEPPAVGENDNRRQMVVPLIKTRLHLAGERMVVIEWVIGNSPGAGARPGRMWQHMMELHHRRDGQQVATIADVLDVNEAIRFVASPFYNDCAWRTIRLTRSDSQAMDAEAVLQLGGGVSSDMDRPIGWFAALAEPHLLAIGLNRDTVRLCFDARARSVHALVPVGSAPETDAGRARENVVLARLAGVDSHGEATPYDTDFTITELEGWRYRRYAGWGTHFAASGYSFAVLAHGDFAIGHLSERAWFSAEPIWGTPAKGHVQSMYWTMFLMTMLHNATFDALASEHALAVQARRRATAGSADADRATASIRDLRSRLADYVASLWFADVSPELQGEDLYRLMLRRSGAAARFDRLRQAFADADAVEADRQEESTRRKEEEARKRRDNLEWMGSLFGAAIIIMTLAGPIIAYFAKSGARGTVTPNASSRSSITMENWSNLPLSAYLGNDGAAFALAVLLCVGVAGVGVFIHRTLNRGHD